MRLRTLAPLLAAALGVPVPASALASGAEPWPACAPRTAPVHTGVEEIGQFAIGRLLTLKLRSRSLGNVQPVRVLLPVHYDRSGRTRYPVLYLLHGAGGDYRSWTDGDAVQKQIGGMPVIAVMPNGSQDGVDGNYTDWFGLPPGAAGQAPAWESFHIHELVPFIDAHFPTRASAAGRAIAGISMGGGGATKYAAENPGMFGYAGTFSGESNPLLPIALAFQATTCKWGDPTTEQVLWRDNDSANLAGNLRGVRIFIRSGDGTPGPYDMPAPPAGSLAALVRRATLIVEYGAHLENQAFVAALHKAGVRDVNVRFFPGSHSQPYWHRDMQEFLPWLRAQLHRPPATPAAFSVASAHPAFTAWGWHFTTHRKVREFAYVKVSGDKLTATGSGRLDIITPARYPPGAPARIHIGSTARRVTADRHGRVTLSLALGPSHSHQQTAFDSNARRGWRSKSVTITPA